MTESRSAGDGGFSQKQRPHRPGRTITCYYCGLVLHEKHLQAHMNQCHLVLEGCPNKCGMTVERHAMQQHVDEECVNRKTNTATLTRRKLQEFQAPDLSEGWNEKLVTALSIVKKALLGEENKRIKSETELKLELKKLSQRMTSAEDCVTAPQVSKAQFLELKEEVKLLRLLLSEEKQNRLQTEQEFAYQIHELNLQVQDLRLELQQYFQQIEIIRVSREQEMHTLMQEQHDMRRIETELKMEAARLEDICGSLEQLETKNITEWNQITREHDVRKEEMKKHEKDMLSVKVMMMKCCEEVDQFREFLSSENVMISGLWAEQLTDVKAIKEKLENLLKMSEMKAKEFAQMKQRLSECDETLTRQTRGNNIVSVGHIVWKITDFEMKMGDAKDNNTPLLSPVFYSSPYGYKLRVEVRLNGLGQWTGRHMTASLQVLEGEWDALLQWPFSRKVTLTLRDQAKPPDKVNDLVKNLVAGQEKEDPAGLYVFIPHATLQRHNYIVNNTIFLQVTVD